ncbi:MBG domain-containing protein [Myroides sp. LJL119]
MRRLFFFLFLFLFCFNALSQGNYTAISPSQNRIYVTPEGTGNGSSWQQATTLADAVKYASEKSSSNLEIWVAKGTHKPAYEVDSGKQGSSQKAGFLVMGNLKIYGGFNGDETQLDQRDWYVNPTIISGDLKSTTLVSGRGETLNISGNELNSYRVFYLFVDKEIIIDGVTITGGHAKLQNTMIVKDKLISNSRGAAAFLASISSSSKGSIVFSNVIFQGNQANLGGGALSTYEGSGASLTSDNKVVVINSLFTQNMTNTNGGAIEITPNRNIQIVNSTISGNFAQKQGGAIAWNTNQVENSEFNSYIRNSIIFYNASQDDFMSYYYVDGLLTRDHVDFCSFANNKNDKAGEYSFSSSNLATVIPIAPVFYQKDDLQYPYYSVSVPANSKFITNTKDAWYLNLIKEYDLDGRDLAGRMRYPKNKFIQGSYELYCDFVTPAIVENDFINYKLNQKAEPLSAQPTDQGTLRWYNQLPDGSIDWSSGVTKAPTPGTSEVGQINYYVTNNLSNTCESEPQIITVNVHEIVISVQPDFASKFFAEEDPELRYSVNGTLPQGYKLIGTLDREPGEYIGQFIINKGTLALEPEDLKIGLEVLPAFFTIKQATVEIQPLEGQSKLYAQEDPVEYLYQINKPYNQEYKDYITGGLQRQPGEQVGYYQFELGTLKSEVGPNDIPYLNLTLATGNIPVFTINPLTIKITPDSNQSKIYGDPEPKITYTTDLDSSSLPLEENLLIRADGQKVGHYSILLDPVIQEKYPNYEFIVLENSGFEITKKKLEIKADNKEKIYGRPDPLLSYTLNVNSLPYQDQMVGELTRDSGQSVESYTITQGSLTIENNGQNVSENYDIEYIKGLLTIISSPLTIVGENVTKIFGDSDPAFNYTLDGELYYDDKIIGNITREEGEQVGNYEISVESLQPMDSKNYAVNHTNAILDIQPAMFSNNIKLQDPKVLYDGTQKQVTLIGELPQGTLEPVFYYSQNNVPVSQPINAGSYQVKTLLENENFVSKEIQGTLTIEKAAIQGVELVGKSFVYDGEQKQLTATGTTTGDQVNYQNNSLTNVGKNQVQANIIRTDSNGDENYWPLNLEAFLEITPATIQDITFDDYSADYTGQPIQVPIEGTKDRDIITLEYRKVGQDKILNQAISAGEYDVYLTLERENYFTYKDTVSLTITPVDIEGLVELNPKVVDYNSKEFSLEFTGDVPVDATQSILYKEKSQSQYTSQKPVNAGKYDVKGTISGDNINTIVLESSLTIRPIQIPQSDLTLVGLQQQFTDQPICLTPTSKNSLDRLEFESYTNQDGQVFEQCPMDVGTYFYVADFQRYNLQEVDSNYVRTEIRDTLIITKADILDVVLQSNYEFTYDSNEKSIQFEGNIKPQASQEYTYYDSNNNPLDGFPVNVGDYYLEAKLDYGENYHVLNKTATIQISPMVLELQANNVSVTYGLSDQIELSFTVKQGSLGINDAYCNHMEREAGNNVGSYTISQGDLSICRQGQDMIELGNYLLNFSEGEFEITPAALQIKAQSKKIVFSQPIGVLDYSYNGELFYTDKFQGNLELEAKGSTDVGEYEIQQGSLTIIPDAKNYQIEYEPGILTIEKDTIRNVFLSDAEFEYDQENKRIFVQGDLPSDQTKVSYTYYLNDKIVQSCIDVGKYKVQAIVRDKNYEDLHLEASLEIFPAEIKDVYLPSESFQYDGNTKSLQVKGLQVADSVSYVNNALTNVGSQDVTAYVNRGDNYLQKQLQAQLSVTPAPITGLTLNNKNVEYTAEPIELKVEGALDTDQVTYVYSLDDQIVQQCILPGIYQVQATVKRNDNYKIWKQSAKLTIVPSNLEDGPELRDQEFNYTGAAQGISLQGDLPPNATVSYIYKDQNGTPLMDSQGRYINPVDAGVYLVQVSITAPGYEDIDLQATLTILPIEIPDLELNDLTQPYTGEPICLQVENYQKDDVISYVYQSDNQESVDCPINADTYRVTATVQRPGNGNYLTTKLQGELKITPKEIQVTFSDKQVVYNGENQEIIFSEIQDLPYVISASYTYFKNGSSQALEGTPVDAGYYKVIGELVLDANYKDITETAFLTIKKREVMVMADDVQTFYGIDKQISYNLSPNGIANTDTYQGSLSYSGDKNVGIYPITQGDFTIIRDNQDQMDNYLVSYNLGNYIINASKLVVVPTDSTKVYNTSDPSSFLYTLIGQTYYQDKLHGDLYREQGEDVGSYAIFSDNITVDNPGNYDLITQEGKFTITKGTMSGLSLNDQEFTYNQKTQTIELEGKLPSQNTKVFNVYRLNNRVLNNAINQGEYTQITTVTDPNYNQKVFSATLIISPAEIQGLIFQSEVFDYNGKQHSLQVQGALPTDQVLYSDNNALTNVGIQQVTATVTRDQNYQQKVLHATLQVIEDNLDLTILEAYSRTYTGQPIDDLQVIGVLEQDTVEWTFSQNNQQVSPIETGEYQAEVSVFRNSNYNIWKGTSKLTIVAKQAGEMTLEPIQVDYTGSFIGLQVQGDIPDNAYITYTYTDQNNLVVERPVDVGQYTCVAAIHAPNFQSETLESTLVINPGAIVGLDITDKSTVYTGEPICLQAIVPQIDGIYLISSTYMDSQGNSSSDCPVNAGVYTLTLVYGVKDNGNYKPTQVQGELTILKGTANEFELDDASYTYDGTAKTLLVTGITDPNTKVEYAYFDVKNTNTALQDAPINVGSYIVKATVNKGDNYNPIILDGNLEILARELAISAKDTGKIYGENDPELDYIIENLIEKDTDQIQITLERQPQENVGKYAINLANIQISDNYSYHYQPGVFTIGKKPITVTATNAVKEFGQDDPQLLYQASQLIIGDSFSGTLERVSGQDVGVYCILLGSLTAGENYQIHYQGANLTIQPKELIIKAQPVTVVYGQWYEQLDYQVQGLVEPDTPQTVLKGTLATTNNKNVGVYDITQGSLSLVDSNKNYQINYQKANFEITKAPLEITALNAKQSYGQQDLKYTYNVMGIQYKESLKVALTGELERQSGNNVGLYAINQGSLQPNRNYYISRFTPAELSIVAVAVKVKPYNTTVSYAQMDPVIDYQLDKLFYQDTKQSVFTGELAIEPTSDALIFKIVQGTLQANENYLIDFDNSSRLMKTPVVLTVTANNQTKIYGEPDPELSYQVKGLVHQDQASEVLSGSLSVNHQDLVGRYPIEQGSLVSSIYYSLNFVEAELQITPAKLSIVADSQTKVYGDNDPSFSYQIQGLVNQDQPWDALFGVLQREPGQNANHKYQINLGDLISNGNYIIDYVPNYLTINQRELVITPELTQKTYGQPDPVIPYQTTGLQYNQTPQQVLSGELSRDQGQNSGTYKVTIGTLKSDPNYFITLNPGEFLINKAEQSILNFDQTIFVDFEQNQQINLNASSSSGLPVSYTYQDLNPVDFVKTDPQGHLEFNSVGSMRVTAHQSGNENYNPVSSTQNLIVESQTLNIDQLIVNGQVFSNVDGDLTIELDCLEDQQGVHIQIKVNKGVEVWPSDDIQIEVVNGQPVNNLVDVTLSNESGKTKKYQIRLNPKADTSKVLLSKYDNLIFVNNNPQTNGGYRFSDFKIYKNDQLIASQQVYSQGQTIDDQIDFSANYYAILTTQDGQILQTCPVKFAPEDLQDVSIAPNPVRLNEYLEINFKSQNKAFTNSTYQLYNAKGQLLDKGVLTQKESKLYIKNTWTPGSYFLILKYDGITKSFTLLIKN